MRVPFEIEEEEFEGDYGTVQGLRLTCSRCGHEVEVYGIDQPSIAFGACTFREQCPNQETNYYVPANE